MQHSSSYFTHRVTVNSVSLRGNTHSAKWTTPLGNVFQSIFFQFSFLSLDNSPPDANSLRVYNDLDTFINFSRVEGLMSVESFLFLMSFKIAIFYNVWRCTRLPSNLLVCFRTSLNHIRPPFHNLNPSFRQS